MGGNAFQDTEKLTPEEYKEIVGELMKLIGPICRKIEPYLPLPEKDIHGDVDFLLILKEGFVMLDIIGLMKLEKGEYILNNNLTANTVYCKKQVDFNVTKNEEEMERCRFYKSYGGIGAFLGLLLPSKLVKFSEDGIFCCRYQEHIKLEFKVADDVKEFLLFYGLNADAYYQGFKTRVELFRFLLDARFLNPLTFISKKPQRVTKLLDYFQKFLIQNEIVDNPKYEEIQDPIAMTIKFFKKEQEFEQAWKVKLDAEYKKKDLANKWNGVHIMEIFGVSSKQINELKRKFEKTFESRSQLQSFIESHSVQDIASAFSKACNIEPVQAHK